MPFGLKNAPATMSRAMDDIFREENRKICLVYLDDLIVFSQGVDHHMKCLEEVFRKMWAWDLKLKPSKCFFIQESVSYLGHQISKDGIIPDPERTRAYREFPIPKNVRDIRSFLGFASFYRRFINNFSKIAQPLNLLLKKNQPFVWCDAQQKAFETLKDKVLNPPVLAHHDTNASLILRTDSCTYGLGGHLIQVPVGADRTKGQLLACTSRTLSPAERNYSITDLECLAIVFSIDKFRPYLYGREFLVETDHHALCSLMRKKNPAGRLCRWANHLQEYKFTIKYNSGKNHGDADCLSRYPLEANPRDLDKEYCEVIEPRCSVMTLNCNTRYSELKDNNSGESTEIVSEALTDKPNVNTKQINFENSKTAEMQRTDPEWSTIYEIKSSGDASNALKRRIHNHYILQNNLLYKRVINGDENRYLLCVPKAMISDLLMSYHDTPSAGHLGQKKTYKKITERYFWPKAKADITEYVKTCIDCQTRKGVCKPPAGLYQPIPIPENVFKEVSLDLVGPMIETPNGNRYLLTINCRLTKFAFAKALKDIKDVTVMHALKYDYIARYGIPDVILTDRGTNLCSAYSENVFKELGIEHRQTTAMHPETNGQTENFNKMLANMIAITAGENRKNWDEYVESLVLAYNSAKHSVTDQTPYFMVFGRNPKVPCDKAFGYQELVDKFLGRDKQLDKLNQTKQNAKTRLEKRQLINKNIKDKHRTHYIPEEGDYVLLSEPQWKLSRGGKLLPRYSGPYLVLTKLNDLVYELVTLDDTPKSAVVNVRRLKPYHARERFLETRDIIEAQLSAEELIAKEPEFSEHSSDDSDIYLNATIDETEESSDSDTEIYDYPIENETLNNRQNGNIPLTKRTGNRKVRKPSRYEDYFIYEIVT